MNAHDYEAYVEAVVSQLSFWRDATVARNRRFPGVRQSGSYEIDISFELDLTDLARLHVIVECKNHRRPVTRPTVQQLAQTRDAIGAHKAAIASPVGFSSGAVDVARDLGIALWVIAWNEPSVMVVQANTGLRTNVITELYRGTRDGYLRLLGIEPESIERADFSLLDASESKRLPRPRPMRGSAARLAIVSPSEHPPPFVRFSRRADPEAPLEFAGEPAMDEHHATSQILSWLSHRIDEDPEVQIAYAALLRDWETDALMDVSGVHVLLRAGQWPTALAFVSPTQFAQSDGGTLFPEAAEEAAKVRGAVGTFWPTAPASERGWYDEALSLVRRGDSRAFLELMIAATT